MKNSVLYYLLIFKFCLIILIGCNEKPSISIKYPKSNEKIIKDTTIIISIESKNNGKYLKEVRLYVDNVGITSLKSFPFKYKLNTGNLTTGKHILKAKAIDNKGNISENTVQLVIYIPQGILEWRFKTGGDIYFSPAISDDGTIYAGSMDKYLYAINPDGSIKWRFKAENLIWSSPLIDSHGTIYVGSGFLEGETKLDAINPDGSEKWCYNTNDNIWSSAAVDNNGNIYFGSHDNFIYALYPNGTLKWRLKTNDVIESSPAIGPNGTIFVGSRDEYLYAINPNGSLK